MAGQWWEMVGLGPEHLVGPRQVPEGNHVPGVTGRPATPGEERVARLALDAIGGRSDARMFSNWCVPLPGRGEARLDLVVLCDRSVTVIEHLERPTAEMLRLGGGDGDWTCSYPDGQSFTVRNPLGRNDAFLDLVRDRWPEMERLSLAVLDDGCPTDADLPIDVRRPDGTRRMVVRERSVPGLLRDLVGRNSTPEQSAASAGLRHFLTHRS